MKINLAVLFGGKSVEHEVSIISAVQAMASFDTNKYEVIPVYITKDNQFWYGPELTKIESYRDIPALLKTCQRVTFQVRGSKTYLEGELNWLIRHKLKLLIDVAFPIVHGTNVEDGALQGLLETLNLAYVGPNVLASAVGMDKFTQKVMLAHGKFPVLPALRFSISDFHDGTILESVETDFDYPVMVKPNNLGSSIGISRADNAEELRAGLDLAFSFARFVLVEPAVQPLREINCAVLGDTEFAQASQCEEPIIANRLLSYEDKYVSGGKTGGEKSGMASLNRKIPPDISAETNEHIRTLAVAAFRYLGLCGVTRVDFLLNQTSGEIWINEVNTIPGSLSFYLWTPLGVSYTELLDRLVGLALARQRQSQDLTYVVDTNILATAAIGSKASKIG